MEWITEDLQTGMSYPSADFKLLTLNLFSDVCDSLWCWLMQNNLARINLASAHQEKTMEVICEQIQLLFGQLPAIRPDSTLELLQAERLPGDSLICSRASETKWNSPSLCNAFYNGLPDVIKDELTARDPPSDLDKSHHYCHSGQWTSSGAKEGESPVS